MQFGQLRRRTFVKLLGGAAAWALAARAQLHQRLIGVLIPSVESDPAGQSRVAVLRNGLAKLGWTQSNLQMEVRWGSNPALIKG